MTQHITIPRAVVEQALEALKFSRPHFGVTTVKKNEAITALRAALERPEPEPEPDPVAWMNRQTNELDNGWDAILDKSGNWIPLYTRP